MKNKAIKILAIETSCDETAAAVIRENEGEPVILSNVVSSQIDLHAKTGGVVPEVASRAHMEAIMPVIAEAFISANSSEKSSNGAIPTLNSKLSTLNYKETIGLFPDITHIAVTSGPGLIGSLLVGFNAAKSLSYSRDLPVIPVNHIEGHIYSVFGQLQNGQAFPILALTVSGGHTSLNLMKGHGEYESIGDTLDDAVGEAYDKVGKLLGLGYPGGPAISKLAQEFRNRFSNLAIGSFNNLMNKYPNGQIAKSRSLIVFPRPIINDGTFNFSFSGLKTAVLSEVKKNITKYNVENSENIPENVKEEIAFAFEEAVADVLAAKTVKAVLKFNPKTVIFAGGVSANIYLQDKIRNAVVGCQLSIDFLTPPRALTGDNAAMIGIAAFYHIKRGNIKSWDKITVDSNWELN